MSQGLTLQQLEQKYPGISDLFGKVPDSTIGEKFGITKQAVALHRVRLQIPCVTKQRESAIVDSGQLGKISDRELANKLGLNKSLVTLIRKRRHIISPAEMDEAWYEQTKYDILPLLGTVSDYVLAERFGISHNTVCKWRKEFDIQPCQKWHRGNKIPREEVKVMLEEKKSYDEIAKHFECSVGAIGVIARDIRYEENFRRSEKCL